MTQEDKILIIGAGAIGGITAGFLEKAGLPVTVVCKHEEIVSGIRKKGLHIKGVKGEFYARPHAVAKIDELSEKFQYVFLATKANDVQDISRKLSPYLTENSAVVSMQNGICEDTIAEIIGKERVISCVVGWGATMHDYAELEMTSTGEFVIGNLYLDNDERLQTIKEILETILPVYIFQNMIGYLYSKLIINSCITSLGGISGLLLGEMLSKKVYRNLFIRIMQEAMQVADAMKIKVEPYTGKLDYYSFLKNNSFFQRFRRHLIIYIIGAKYRRLKSSTLQSLERGKPTEIDFLNGYITTKARDAGISTPLNDRIVSMIKEIEAGKRKIGEENIRELRSLLK